MEEPDGLRPRPVQLCLFDPSVPPRRDVIAQRAAAPVTPGEPEPGQLTSYRVLGGQA